MVLATQVFTEEEGPLLGITAMASLFPTTKAAAAGLDAPRVVPLERWDVDGTVTDARFGSFVTGADMFDASAFSISR
jgi:hypothetical protein